MTFRDPICLSTEIEKLSLPANNRVLSTNLQGIYTLKMISEWKQERNFRKNFDLFDEPNTDVYGLLVAAGIFEFER